MKGSCPCIRVFSLLGPVWPLGRSHSGWFMNSFGCWPPLLVSRILWFFLWWTSISSVLFHKMLKDLQIWSKSGSFISLKMEYYFFHYTLSFWVLFFTKRQGVRKFFSWKFPVPTGVVEGSCPITTTNVVALGLCNPSVCVPRKRGMDTTSFPRPNDTRKLLGFMLVDQSE